jgi:glycosyltransferase involved in cell wall biosynthesis
VDRKAIIDFNTRNNFKKKKPVIGLAARFASEKGIEVFLNSLDQVLTVFPDCLVWFAGPYEKIIGEENYLKKLLPEIKRFEEKDHWTFLGTLDREEMACFYPNLDVLVVPSLNSTESFGLVQIEAMMNGVQVVASDLPGVRQPVKWYKMGKLFPIGDSSALAHSLIEILNKPLQEKSWKQILQHIYSPDTVAEQYERLIFEIQQEIY